jgi:hypothetical protein
MKKAKNAELGLKGLAPESSNYLITQSAEIPIEQRIFTDFVYLGVNDSADNWMDISKNKANALINEQEEVFKQQIL